MRSQVLLAEAVLVFAAIAILLLFFVPLHQDTFPLLKKVRELDEEQVKRLLEG